jgi:hypothetical protein
MSLEIFKQNMLSYMQNQTGIESYGDFAKKLTMEYDMAVKRGFDSVNNISIAKGNTDLMEATLNGILNTALQQSDGEHPIITNLGPAFIAYWTGATMNSIPPPIVPSPGSILNIASVSSFITDPGIWKPTDTLVKPPPIPPAPPKPAPQKAEPTSDEDDPELDMTSEDVVEAKKEIKQAEQQIEQLKIQGATDDDGVYEEGEFDPDYPPVGVSAQLQAAKEVIAYQEKRITTGKKHSTDFKYEGDPPNINETDIGKRIVAYARLDIGKLEDPLPPGTPANSGGYVLGLLKKVGINGPAFWCAAFVSKPFRLAGAKSPNSAGCKVWSSWGRKNKLFSKEPRVGAAVLYGGLNTEHHIGIVSSIIDKNTITTIEGNTSGGGFSRNGVGVFEKKVKVSRCSGFVWPTEK